MKLGELKPAEGRVSRADRASGGQDSSGDTGLDEVLLHHALAEPAAENRAHQNRDHRDEERAGVDVDEYAVDVGCVLAARLQARHVGVLHEPQGQDRAGQAVGEHHVADEQ